MRKKAVALPIPNTTIYPAIYRANQALKPARVRL
jgi:hypothetical protein